MIDYEQRARALPLLNRKKKRDCLQSMEMNVFDGQPGRIKQ